MQKPTILEIDELKENIIRNIESSNLPIFCILPIIYEIQVSLNEINKREKEKAIKEWKEGEKDE